MKRSEAVKLIVDTYGDDFYLDEYRAKEILNALENAGMLPPSRPSDDGFTGHVSSLTTNTWEPEDEK